MSRTIGKAAATLALVVFVLACASGKAPRWNYDTEGRPSQYKRYPRNIQVDYASKFRRVAYKKVTRPIESFLTDEQRQWVGKHSQPDYRRRSFWSRESERVDEWIYLTQNILVQFVQGHVAYEGEVTDVERIMITHGYPRGCIIGQSEPGTEQWTFVYSRPFDLEREVYSFANGKLLFRQTLR